MSDSDRQLDDAEAWERTTAAIEERADERREAGWEVVTVLAEEAHPDADWYHGPAFVLTIDGSAATAVEEVVEAVERGFTKTKIHRASAAGQRFVGVEALAVEEEHAVLYVFAYDPTVESSAALERAARADGEVRTVLRRPEGDLVAVFTHGDAAPFFEEG